MQSQLFVAASSGNPDAVESRWVLAKTGLAHLDLGERSSESLRVKAEHVIVTACRAHVDAASAAAPELHKRRCSNCVQFLLTQNKTYAGRQSA
jgi:hypothetical protein